MIDEKKLIEETQKYFVNNSIHKNDLAEVIANLPKVGQWIPCSERLPDVEYVSGKDPIKGHYLTCDHDGNVGVLPWCEGWNCYRHLNGSAHKDYEITDVVAWMPLPRAYKESED